MFGGLSSTVYSAMYIFICKLRVTCMRHSSDDFILSSIWFMRKDIYGSDRNIRFISNSVPQFKRTYCTLISTDLSRQVRQIDYNLSMIDSVSNLP